jgi:cytochrome c oxidase subunit 2
MPKDFHLFPTSASTISGEVDAITLFAIAVSIFFSLLIVGILVFFSVRYRRRRQDEVGAPVHGSLLLEVTWTVIPLGIVLFLFGWGFKIFYESARIPRNAMEYWATSKQWMWKFQHPTGQREINRLHVPVGTPIRLTMTSEDVIHSFFVPEFRVKQDVIPGRYTVTWFQATRIGTFRLFCAEYCGAEHSKMLGEIVVMSPQDYALWLAGRKEAKSPALSGEELFVAKSCNTCHRPDSEARAPILDRLFGREVRLAGGGRATVDETYLRESILDPHEKIVEGFQPIMPTFQGQISEEELTGLISYLKGLGNPAGEAIPPVTAATTGDAARGGAR